MRDVEVIEVPFVERKTIKLGKKFRDPPLTIADIHGFTEWQSGTTKPGKKENSGSGSDTNKG
jgi:hypothetical protein